MPDEKEVLTLELQVLAKYDKLEKIQNILAEAGDDAKALDKAIKKIGALKNLSKGPFLKAKDPIKIQKWQQLVKAYKLIEESLNNRNKQKGTITKILGFGKEQVYVKPQESAKPIKNGKLTKVAIYYKDDEIDSTSKTYTKVSKDKNKKIVTSETWKDGELKSDVKKITYSLTKLPKQFDKLLDNKNLIKQQTKTDAFGNPVEYKTYQRKKLFSKKTQQINTVDDQIVSFTEEEAGGGKLNNFVKRIKNIVLYRLVRVAMSAIAKGVGEGFQLLASNNSAYKNVMADLKSSTTALSITFAQMLLPIAQTLSTALQSLSTRFVEIGNAIALNQAMLNGETKYFKISQKAIDDYAKSLQNANAALTQLDKFATLSQGSPLLGSYEDVTNASDEEIKSAQKMTSIFENLKTQVDEITESFKNFGQTIKTISEFSEGLKSILKVGLVTALVLIATNITKVKALFVSFRVEIALLLVMFTVLSEIASSKMPNALKILLAALVTLAGVLTYLVVATDTFTGAAKVAHAIGAAVAAVTALGGLALAKNKYDSGVSEATSYDSGLASGNTLTSTNDAAYNAIQGNSRVQVSTTTSDVILDGHKVGKALTKNVFYYGAKAGY